MHLSTLATVVASLASAAVTSASPDLLPFRNDALLDKRALSPEAKRCHKSCGYTIMGAVKEGYCKDPAWKELQEACNECALTQDNIAKDYHNDLEAALTPCHLEPPAISGGGAKPSSAAPSSSAAAQPTSAAAQPTSAAVVQPSSSTQGSSRVGLQPSSSVQESSVAVVVPTSTGSDSHVSSSAGTVVSATSTSITGGSQANASTTARPSSAANSDARSSHVVASSSLVATFAVLFAAAML
ncbi:hypothetical protein G6O67_003082 [Ophiocordyceps sinensis]|uniref:Uncharacterized protein n=2 Tax=Ophiocordyceps sinensis TaxID=72228 RepID=A0A8H4PVI8_9HYPO|nr:hypothetical protein OCS_02116 [Ophiocordyceps sinensis CO18]KAF4511270.1 hypothetical protein G6O67_003082 [Ophiocordyceps sinensis]